MQFNEIENIDIFSEIDADINHFQDIYPDLFNENSSKYYDINSFNSIDFNSNHDLAIIHINARSLNANFDQFYALFDILKIKFDVICVSESWLDESISNLFNIEGYNAFHSHRSSRGGGSIIYVRNIFSCNVINTNFNMQFANSIILNISYQNKSIIVGTFYRSQKADSIIFIENFLEILTNVNLMNNDEIIICGDFNFDLLKLESCNISLDFFNAINTCSLIPTITKPTRVNESSASLLDNILVKNPISYISGIIQSDITDHYPVFYINKNFLPTSNDNSNITIRYRIINDDTISALRHSLISCNLEDVIQEDDLNLTMQNFSDLLFSNYDNCCPIKTKTLSHKTLKCPWISNEIKSHIKKRDAYAKLCKAGKIPKNLFRNYRNFVTNFIRQAKINYFEEKFNRTKDNIKNTWKTINNILKTRPSKQNKIGKIVHENVIYDNNSSISGIINEYFINIGSKIAESSISNLSDHKIFLHGNFPKSFFISPVSAIEISRTIKSLKNKSCGIHSLPIKILKSIHDIISPTLSIIVNSSFSNGIFPDILKQAKVTPIKKPGNSTNISNYRPISILPSISKIFEKIIHKQLYSYLEENNILFINQFGFRNKKSTTQAILNFTQFLYDSLDKGNNVISLFLDFKKAFDCVNHHILLSKLEFYGIRGVAADWFKSYLENRKQSTIVGDRESNLLQIKNGVPQGSILGPLLFLIFINDLPNSSKIFKFILFADDSTLSLEFRTLNYPTISLINSELENVNRWLKYNKIAINSDKTKFIIFSYRKNINFSPLIKIGGSTIQSADCIKFLGVFVDKHLKFNNHANYISSKLSKSVGILYKLSKYLPTEILKLLYYTLVQPYFNYSIEVWFSTYKNVTNRLNILQKKACRAINKLSFFDHTLEAFKSMSILKLNELYTFKIAILMYKSFISIDDSNSYLSITNFNHDHNTRCRNHLPIPIFRRSVSQFSIKYASVKIWNEIPIQLKNAKSLYSFKKNLKIYLLSKYTPSL